MTDVTLSELTPSALDDNLDEAVAVYAAALGEDPVASGSRMRTEVLPRHRAREGFRFIVARDAGEIVGIGYGYVGAPGQCWTDRVAAVMSADDQRRWLHPPHFEVVELHVRPDRQSQGIGRRLLAALVDDLELPHALLSTAETNVRGRAFYAANGWIEIQRGVDLGSWRGPYVILAKELGETSS